MDSEDSSPSTDRGPDAAPGGALRLPAVLDLATADGLHAQIQDRLSRDRALRIDGGDVERASTACLQVLVAAAIGARANGSPFALCASSAVLRDAARDLGLLGALGLEES